MLSFDKYYRLPCTMKVNAFKRLINNKIPAVGLPFSYILIT